MGMFLVLGGGLGVPFILAKPSLLAPGALHKNLQTSQNKFDRRQSFLLSIN